MRHHRRIFAAIIAGALLTLSAACHDPDPFGTLDQLIGQPSHASDVARAAHHAYRTNPTIYALEYRGQPITVYGTIRQRGEDWAQIYHQTPRRYRIRCEFSEHIRQLANARTNQEATFQGEMLHTKDGILTLSNCRQP